MLGREDIGTLFGGDNVWLDSAEGGKQVGGGVACEREEGRERS